MSHRRALLTLLKHGLIPADRIDEAIAVSNVHPSDAQWFRFVDRLLLVTGVVFVSLAAIFFFAYNWADLGKFAKFASCEIAVIVGLTIYLYADRDSLLGKSTLLATSLFVGALLALFGQIYQTGADTWQLFFSWAALITPWVLVSRFSSLYILWLALCNLSVLLYFKTFGGVFNLVFVPLFDTRYGAFWGLFLLNTSALSLWEWASNRFDWLRPRWAPRLIAIASGVPITWLALLHIVDDQVTSMYVIPSWMVWAACVYFYYRSRRRDLFMLCGLALSLSAILITYLAEALFSVFDSGAFLIVAILIIGAGSGAALWLRKVHQEWSI